MKHLWAPWRLSYILGPKPDACVFCLPQHTDEDEERLVLHRGKRCFVIMNKFPYNCGHLLVLPLREIGDIELLDGGEKIEFFDAVIRAKRILRRALNPDAFNVGFNLGSKAGAGIPRHLHCHVVPRWDGDTNFMPVISDTRVLPQSLDALWQKLVKFADEE